VSADNTSSHAAAVYDQGVRQTIPFYETIQQQALDLIQTVKPEPACWLDTGCGTGYLVSLAAPLFPQTRFILADPSAGMLEQARQRFAGRFEGRLEFLPPQPSEALAAWQPAKKPQVITALLCHHYLQPAERRRAVQACYDRLENNGLFVVFEIIELTTPEGTAFGLKRWRDFQLEAGRSTTAVEAHLQRYKTEILPIPVAEHVALLKSAGFQTVEHFWLSQMQAGFYAIK
jgi:tRNA (cmo5U34)-methyltransferase